MKYRAVIFDMDGVIFDSEQKVLEEWQILAQRYHIPNLEEAYIECIGTTREMTEAIFTSHYGPDFPYDMYKKECSRSFHEKYDNGRLPMKAGVTELLQFLKQEGYLIGLASSTRTEIVMQEIRDAGLLPYFDHLTCGDMLKKSKPEPDIYLMACSNLGVEPAETVAIEDSYNGIRSAFRAGMAAVMVPDMVAPDEEMKRLSTVICDNLTEVKEWLKMN